MKIRYIRDPEVVTGQLRQLDIFRRQRREGGLANTATSDLIQEGEILCRLLVTELVIRRNIIGEGVRGFLERT